MRPDNTTPSAGDKTRERRAEALTVIRRYGFDRFTCDDCRFADRCEFAFDPYNTDGDCLEAK